MSSPRRRIVRPQAGPSPAAVEAKRQKLVARLQSEQIGLVRWQRRLKRAFNAVSRHQKNVTRVERQLAQMEGS